MINKENEKIFENVKLKISISNFEEEENLEMKKSNNNTLKIATVACCMLVLTTGVVFAKEIGEFVKHLFGVNVSEGVDTAVENGFIARPKLVEQSAEGINVTVENFMMDDYNFGINFILAFDDKNEAKKLGEKDILLQDLKIVDEENNIVFSTNYYKEDYEKQEFYYNGFRMNSDLIEDNKIRVSLITSGGITPFPKSKKLKITFKRIAEEIYPLSEEELSKTEENVYIGDWNFEVDVPEEMYKREVVTYKVKSCNDKNTVVENATLSNTAFKISIPVTTTDKIDYKALYDRENMKSIYSLIALQKEYVETSDGKRFESSKDGNSTGYSGASDQEKITDYKQTFNLTKYDATDELTVHIFTNKGEEIIIEFEKIK